MNTTIEKGRYIVTRYIHVAQSLNHDDWDILTENPMGIVSLLNDTDDVREICKMAASVIPDLKRFDLQMDVENRSDQEYVICQSGTGRPLAEVSKIKQGNC